jgi:hypothetical protein
MPCIGAGAAMLAVPTVLQLLAPPPTTPRDSSAAVVVTVVLAVGAVAIMLAALRPQTGIMPALALFCVALALVLVPPEPLWDGVCGFAGTVFLLTVRMNRLALSGAPATVRRWLVENQPMLAGAAGTSSAVVAAAETPAEWSLPVAMMVGLLVGGMCILLLRDRA